MSVVGARPEFVQVGPLARTVQDHPGQPFELLLVHTGQHYDENMSSAFFAQLRLPEPAVHLGVGSGSPAAQTGEMISRLDPVLRDLQPDVVVVFGDTNSTLAGALASAKLGLRLAHVEAGLRSHNLAMPEEMNRRVTDHVATTLFCPSPHAVKNLEAEGVVSGVHLVGDVMYESLLYTLGLVDDIPVLTRNGLAPGGYAVATVHRAENTDSGTRLGQILLGLSDIAATGLEVVFPVHPRTRARMEPGLLHAGVRLVDPMPHPDMVAMVKNSRLLLTDSGGLQKEAYWLDTPCVTMRDETEWVETVDNGWNRLVGADRRAIFKAAADAPHVRSVDRPPLYGEGTEVSRSILDILRGGTGRLAGVAS